MDRRTLLRGALPALGGLLAAPAAPSAPAAQPAQPAPRSAALTARMDARVAAEMAAQRIPGLALGVVLRGQPLRAQGYGLAQLEHAVRVTPLTRFQSGSVAKQFAAVAVMLLVEEGRLALDAPITRWFADAPAAWSGITVRQLLGHTSGLPGYDAHTVDLRKDYSEDDLTRVAQRLPLRFAPGTRWLYSDTGYVLIGILVRTITGQFYGDFLRDRVFAPLGMHSARVISEADIVPHRAGGYRLVDGEWKNQEWVSPSLNTTADGAMYLSLTDWLRWEHALRRRAVLRPSSWAEVFAPVRLASGKPVAYGLGWELHDGPGPACYLHTGAWQGFQMAYLHSVDADLTVVVLTNLASADPLRVARRVGQLVQPALLRVPTAPLPFPTPALREDARALLQAATRGAWQASDFAHAAPDFFPGPAAELQERLARLGPLEAMDLVDLRDRGDDLALTLRVRYPNATQAVRLLRTPSGPWSSVQLLDDDPPTLPLERPHA